MDARAHCKGEGNGMNGPRHGLDSINPFLLAPAITHAGNRTPKAGQRQQTRGKARRSKSGNKSGSSGSSQPAMLTRGQVTTIAASTKKCREAFMPIIDAINAVTLDAMPRMKRPTAVMLRITMVKPEENLCHVLKQLSEHCMRKSKGVRPAYVWVREIREMDYDNRPGDYPHFHILFLFDRAPIGCGTIIKVLKKLQDAGWLESKHLSDDDWDGKKIVQHDLRNPAAASNYRHHVGYLAKVATKVREDGRRVFGRSLIKKAASDHLRPSPPAPVPALTSSGGHIRPSNSAAGIDRTTSIQGPAQADLDDGTHPGTHPQRAREVVRTAQTGSKAKRHHRHSRTSYICLAPMAMGGRWLPPPTREGAVVTMGHISYFAPSQSKPSANQPPSRSLQGLAAGKHLPTSHFGSHPYACAECYIRKYNLQQGLRIPSTMPQYAAAFSNTGIQSSPPFPSNPIDRLKHMTARNALHKSVIQRLENRVWREYVFEALEVLKGGPVLVVNFKEGETHEIPFMDVYCQAFRSDLVTFEDQILTAVAWQDVLDQRLIYRFIEVREPPYSDKEVAANKAILDDMVSHYRQHNLYQIKDADFWGGTQGADGFIEFDSPFIAEFTGCHVDATPEERVFALANPLNGRATRFPLEVGYCMPDQIHWHLLQARCVARFPYGSRIILFLERP